MSLPHDPLSGLSATLSSFPSTSLSCLSLPHDPLSVLSATLSSFPSTSLSSVRWPLPILSPLLSSAPLLLTAADAARHRRSQSHEVLHSWDVSEYVLPQPSAAAAVPRDSRRRHKRKNKRHKGLNRSASRKMLELVRPFCISTSGQDSREPSMTLLSNNSRTASIGIWRPRCGSHQTYVTLFACLNERVGAHLCACTCGVK